MLARLRSGWIVDQDPGGQDMCVSFIEPTDPEKRDRVAWGLGKYNHEVYGGEYGVYSLNLFLVSLDHHTCTSNRLHTMNIHCQPYRP